MDMFEKFMETITATGKDVTEKTKNGSEVVKLMYKSASEQKSLTDLYTQIGQKFVEGAEDLTDLVEQAKEKAAQIESIKAQIRLLKGVVVCQNCGAEIISDYDFCGKCGAKLEKPEPPVEEEPAAEEAAEEEVTVDVEVVVDEDKPAEADE